MVAFEGGGVVAEYSFLSTTGPQAYVFEEVKTERKGFFNGKSDMWVTKGTERVKRKNSFNMKKQTDAKNK